jgi:hypothetical protein
VAGFAATPPRQAVLDGLVAGSLGGVVSGAPSTAHALASGAGVLESSLAAGSILLPDESGVRPLLLAAVPVHLALSLGWGVVLALMLPRRRPVAFGALGGLLIAALDLAIGRGRFPRVRALPVLPQVADHVAFGAVAGAVIGRRRA